jgi:drug/metabolite transporter (DMT)-like permease
VYSRRTAAVLASQKPTEIMKAAVKCRQSLPGYQVLCRSRVRLRAIAQPNVKERPKSPNQRPTLILKEKNDEKCLSTTFTDSEKRFDVFGEGVRVRAAGLAQNQTISSGEASRDGTHAEGYDHEQDHDHGKSEKLWAFVPFSKSLRALIDRVPARVRGLVMLNVLVVLVATNWVVVKDAGTTFDPFGFASLRFVVAAAALSPFLFKALKRKETVLAGLELGLLTAVGYLAQSEGLLTTEASRASFLSTFTVLVVPFLAGFSGTGVRPLTWAAAVTAVLGVSLLEQGGAPPSMGDVWSIVSAVAFGVQIFRTEHYSRVLGRRQTIPLMSVVLATTAILSGLATMANHLDLIKEYSLAHPGVLLAKSLAAHVPWVEVVYTGLLTTDVALLMELVALRDVSSTEAAIIYTMEPVLGAGLAFTMLGERWGPTGWIGAALIVGSCVGMQIWGKEEGEPVLESTSDMEM